MFDGGRPGAADFPIFGRSALDVAVIMRETSSPVYRSRHRAVSVVNVLPVCPSVRLYIEDKGCLNLRGAVCSHGTHPIRPKHTPCLGVGNHKPKRVKSGYYAPATSNWNRPRCAIYITSGTITIASVSVLFLN